MATQKQQKTTETQDQESVKAGGLKAKVRAPLDVAQKGLQTFEVQTQRALASLQTTATRSREGLEGLLETLEKEHLSGRSLQGLSKHVAGLQRSASVRINALQSQVVESLGVASQRQVVELHRELGRIASRLEGAVPKAARNGKSDPQA